MKKFLSLLLAIVLVLGLAIPAFADEYAENNGNDYYNGYNGYENGYSDDYNGYENGYAFPPVWEMFERPFPGYAARRMFGYVGEVAQADCGNYTVEILDADGEVQLVVWRMVSGRIGTAVIDAVTGFPVDLEDHDGGEVLVIYGPLYTYHDVPQSNALVIAINVEEAEGQVLPNHHVIESIEREGDTALVTVDNGGLIVTLNEDTDLQAWLTRQIVVLDEFQVGDEVLLWYGIVAMSYPAQTTAVRALRLVPAQNEAPEAPEPINEYPTEYYEETPEEPGQLVGGIQRAGVNLYPVRANAAAVGYTVNWNAQYRRAELHLGDTIVTLAPGFAVFYVNGESFSMDAPSLLEGGTLFAPASFFHNL